MHRFWQWPADFAVAALGFLTLCFLPSATLACPFCSAVSLTFSEEIAASDAAVVAKLVSTPAKDAKSTEVQKSKFEIVDILKGGALLGDSGKLETIYFGDAAQGSLFLIMATDAPNLNWSTPIALSPRGHDYINKAWLLPKEGPERLPFFQNYLEDRDEMLAKDAYDEFAKAPYSVVKALKDHMQRDKLRAWIQDPKVTSSRRRLYLTMLGVCGNEEDVALLEKLIKSDDQKLKDGLEAMIASYLTLKGAEGMPLIEDLYIKNKDAEYRETYSAVVALRFHGQEGSTIPKERLLQGVRMMLDRPALADTVIADLARWEDWSVMDKLVSLFKNADDESSWVRLPVIQYLKACPLPKAKEHLAELAKLDPETMKRASGFLPFGPAASPGAEASKRPEAAPAEADDKGGSADKSKTAVPAAKPDKKAGASLAPQSPLRAGAVPADAIPAAASTKQQAAAHGKPGEKLVVAAKPAPSRFPAAARSRAAELSSGRILATAGAVSTVMLLLFWFILRGGQRVTLIPIRVENNDDER